MISYKILNDSIEFYELHKYQRIESPWTVTEYVSGITKPKHIEDLKLSGKNKVLVASGEQSFLYLYLKGFLPKGQFQSITPCFRNDEFDLLHTKYFIKNELIKTDIVNEKELDKIVHICKNFFELKIRDTVEIEKTQDGYDLNYKGSELGSYGIRTCPFLQWIYGTACAEPRLSTILTQYGIPQ